MYNQGQKNAKHATCGEKECTKREAKDDSAQNLQKHLEAKIQNMWDK